MEADAHGPEEKRIGAARTGGRGLAKRGTVGRRRLAALMAWSVMAAILPGAARAEEGIPAGSGAVVATGQPLLVRLSPGWDAAVASELAAGAAVTVWGTPQAAADGSLWYPVDGGFVPVDAVTSVAGTGGGAGSGQESLPGDWVAPAPDGDAIEQPATLEGSVALEQRRGGKDRDADGRGGDRIVAFAMQYVGYPYVYAGEGPDAFDCSGFTKFVIQYTLGIDITHDMATQIDMGTPVGRNELRPGDLVFFADTFEPGLSHNGIYIGDGQFVHAENETTGVRVSDLRAEYYRSRWYGAARFR
jgi:cell wall-associated NlpC family hydrolase